MTREDDPTVVEPTMNTGFLSPAKWGFEDAPNPLFKDSSLQHLHDQFLDLQVGKSGENSPKQQKDKDNKFGAKHYKNRQPYDTRVIQYSDVEIRSPKGQI
jgi:hypothetical protein